MKDIVLVVAFLAVLAGAVVFYQHYTRQENLTIPAETIEPQMPAQPAEEPEIRHPVPQQSKAATEQAPLQEHGAAQVTGPEPTQVDGDRVSLPELDDSDPVVIDALGGFIDRKALRSFFHMDSIIRRFVATIDNLPRKSLPGKYLIAKPAAGRFRVMGQDDSLFLNPKNFRRYSPVVKLLGGLDTKRLVSMYIQYYVLFQEAYEDLGYPSAYFNDRLIDVIDHLLATPDHTGPVRLVRPRVLYQFADPDLEALSSGQKILVRIGPENAAKLKDVLREIRAALTATEKSQAIHD